LLVATLINIYLKSAFTVAVFRLAGRRTWWDAGGGADLPTPRRAAPRRAGASRSGEHLNGVAVSPTRHRAGGDVRAGGVRPGWIHQVQAMARRGLLNRNFDLGVLRSADQTGEMLKKSGSGISRSAQPGP